MKCYNLNTPNNVGKSKEVHNSCEGQTVNPTTSVNSTTISAG